MNERIESQSSEIQVLWNDVTVLAYEKLEQFCSCNDSDIDAETMVQLKAQGQRLCELTDAIFDILKSNARQIRFQIKLSIYWEYAASNQTTLAEIASKYNFSRERVRQIVNRIDEYIFKYFCKNMLLEDGKFNELLRQIAAVFEKIDYQAVLLSVYGLETLDNRKQQVIFNMLFGKSFAMELTEKSSAMKKVIQTRNVIVKKYKNILDVVEFYQSKSCFPSDFSVDPSAPITTYESVLEFEFENRTYAKLKKMESLVEVIKNPDIVYYSSGQTDHRPKFLLRFPNQTSVLVVVLPTINMGFAYNIQRWNELHLFCKEHGYGYLIIDDRGNSIDDIKNRALDPELVSCLDTVLECKNVIFWRDIKEIKRTHSVTNADIAAYVLQNKLWFIREPFYIKRKRES